MYVNILKSCNIIANASVIINNNNPKFTDQEIMTIYIYLLHHHELTTVRHIHRFADEYLRDWFPELGSYQAFNKRLNRLDGAF